mgnify:CR=1 FL=1
MKPERPVRTLMPDDSGEAVTNPFMVTGAFTISLDFKSASGRAAGRGAPPKGHGLAAGPPPLTICAVQHK